MTEFKIFISYARVNKLHMEANLATPLNTNGLNYWCDKYIHETIEESSWKEELIRQIKSAQVFIFLLSQEWLDSEMCLWELSQAEANKLIVIPVMPFKLKDSMALKKIKDDYQVQELFEVDGNKNFIKRVKAASNSLVQATQNINSDRSIDELVQSYIDNMLSKHEYFNVLGNSDKFKLNDIYIEQHICQHIHGHKETCDIPSSEFKGDEVKALVLGAPGSGKTTLLNYLTYKACSNFSTDKIIPIFVRARTISDLDKTIQSWLNRSLISTFGESFTQRCFDPIDKNNGYSLLFLIDGIDEVAQSKYSEFAKDINNFAFENRYIKLITTMRYAPYADNDYKELAIYEINHLEGEKIHKYIKKVVPKKSVNHVWNTISQSPQIYELVKTPFLLALICSAYKSIGPRASQRSVLIKNSIDYLIQRKDWESNRESIPSDTSDTLRVVLKNIAFKAFKLDYSGIFTQEEIIQTIQLVPGMRNDAPRLLELIQQKTGLLQENNEGLSFVHRTIWEYFVAEALIDENIEHIVDDRANSVHWEEPFRLYTGLILNNTKQREYLSQLWSANFGLSLRCMGELEEFPTDLLESLHSQLEYEDKIRLMQELMKTLSRIKSSSARTKLLVDTLNSLLNIEKDCEIVFTSIVLLQKDGSAESLDLIDKILDKSTLKNRLKKYLCNPKYHFSPIKIPKGKFEMGKEHGKLDESEIPAHFVELDSFYLNQYLVTNNLYYSDFPYAIDRRDEYSKEGNQPVNNVNWYESQIFSWWLGGDLPTDAEWEYACRAAGHDDEKLFNNKYVKHIAWYGENSNNMTHPVGEKEANTFDLYDMQGNLREWVKDWFDYNYYQKCLDEGISTNPSGPEKGIDKSIRGGTFDWAITNLRPTYRNQNMPRKISPVTGFRLSIKDLATIDIINSIKCK